MELEGARAAGAYYLGTFCGGRVSGVYAQNCSQYI